MSVPKNKILFIILSRLEKAYTLAWKKCKGISLYYCKVM